MAGELTTLSKLTTAAIGTLAATETLAATLWDQRKADPKIGWIAAGKAQRNEFRLIAARLLIEHHNEASIIDSLETPGLVRRDYIPLDD